MIVQTEKIKLKWNPRNKAFYMNKGYEFTKMNDEFEIDYRDLPETSHQDVLCKCDFCGKEFMRPYFRVVNKDKFGCFDCRSKTLEHNLMKKYNIKNPSQIPYVKEKIAQTNIERYGAPNVFGSKTVREKMEQNNIEKYNVPYPVMTSEVRDRISKTNTERYGGISPFSSEQVREKSKQTNIERYDVPYVTQSKEVQQKMKQTTTEHYGVENPFESKVIQQQIKQTNVRKYGVPYIAQSPKMLQKMHETFVSNEYNHASKEQKYYAKLFNGKLDYPTCACFLDIAFIDKKIYIECDFGGHFIYAKIRGLNEVEMLFRDAKRDKPILSQSWKCIRYLNRGNDFLTDYDMLSLNLQLMTILKKSNINRILVDLNYRIIRFEPGFVVKSIDLFLQKR